MNEHRELRFFKGLTRAVAAVFAALLLVWILAGACGCGTLDEWLAEEFPAGAAEGDDGAEEQPVQEPEAAPAVPAAPAFSAEWRYGGFNGAKAVEDPRCRLGSPKITKDKISYKWESGIPGDWKRGKTSKGMMVVSAAFYWDESEGKWIGGKFDWTDEARTSRDCANIHDGYNGWKGSAWDSATRRAFCVVSADGKWRSNLLED